MDDLRVRRRRLPVRREPDRRREQRDEDRRDDREPAALELRESVRVDLTPSARRRDESERDDDGENDRDAVRDEDREVGAGHLGREPNPPTAERNP